MSEIRMKHMWHFDKKREQVYCLRRNCDVRFKGGLHPKDKLELLKCREKIKKIYYYHETKLEKG